MLSPMREPDDDRELMLRYAKGDALAFEQLYNRHKGPLFRYLARHTGNGANAEEVFQETWIKVIRARERYRPVAKFSTWLYQIAHNCFIDYVRRQGRNALEAAGTTEPDALDAPNPGPGRAAELSETAAKIAAALAALPGEQREAFLLREEGGFSLQEIGSITGVGRETVKSRLRYALARLRAALEDADDRQA